MTNIELRQRFKDADFFPITDVNVQVFGAGGIGSWVTFFLSRIGYQVTLIDFDTVEQHNIGGQFFRVSDIGRFKIDAVKSVVKMFSDEIINTLNFTVTDSTSFIAGPIVVAAFDNMDARKNLFENWVSRNSNAITQPLFVDGRLTMDTIQIISVPYNDESIDKYRNEYLFNNNSIEEEACTAKQSSHTAGMIGSHIVSIIANHISNINIGEKVKPIPFYYEFFAPFQHTTVIDELQVVPTMAVDTTSNELDVVLEELDAIFPDTIITEEVQVRANDIATFDVNEVAANMNNNDEIF